MADRAIFDKKNILVVGGAGFIGSNLCDELVQAAKVICLDNFLTGSDNNIAHLHQNPSFEFINHDINIPIELEKRPELRDFKIEFQGLQEIYFLATPTSPKFYDSYPIETMMANSLGLNNALELAVKYKAKIIYVSSPAVYGELDTNKRIKEDYVGPVDQLGPRSVYAEAKRFGEALVNSYRLKFDIDAKIVRVFNCYGPKMRLDDGRMIPELVKSALNNKDLVVFGKAGDSASYLYISDLLQALIGVMNSGEAGPLNIGSDAKYKFSEVATKIVKLIGSKSAITYHDRGSLMAPQFIADISQVKEKLGWFPITLLDQGLKEIIDYLSAQKGILQPE
ncbi:MAG: NAD-dependent epimerase/dehydratase family protein [Candidatus Buchananbacteria bacterium]|nr:NAD-dependent epimerase/dehydratase family protein [Candidatus Buchananbacteria bacterium]